jgi:plastocyanin
VRLTILLLVLVACARPPPRAVHRVAIRGMQFVPDQLQVVRGDRVAWTNEDLVPHTVTAADQRFDSQVITAGAGWAWTADSAEVVAYACRLHPEMRGSVTVR